jgi:hypothetical protein
LEESPKGITNLTVNRFRTIAAVFLLALWVPMSSHDLLEDWGFIHTPASLGSGDNHDNDHDAADGLCQLPPGVFQVQIFHALQPSFLAAPILAVCLHTFAWKHENFALVNPSPPDIPVGWQFASRAALPIRAPSLLS